MPEHDDESDSACSVQSQDETGSTGDRHIGRVRAAMRGVSAVEWGCLAIGALLTFHYAWVLDDAYVYFRYVDNWILLDRGIVYNEGERVEGYSSPLWLLVLAGSRVLQLPWWATLRMIAVLSFGVFWALTVATNRRMSPPGSPKFGFPTVFLCMNYAVQSYFSSGVEAPLVQLMAPIYALFVLSPGSAALQTAVAIAPLVRHELAVPLAIAMVWVAVRERRIPWRIALVAAVTSGTWLVFRIGYYADWAPNTYYLKTSSDIAQGLRYVHDTMAPYHLYEVLIIAGVAAIWLLWTRRAPVLFGLERLVMVTMALSVAVFVVQIGGDPRHFRYLAFPFCLIVLASSGLVESLLASRPWRMTGSATAVGAGALALLVATLHPRQCLSHPIRLRSVEVRQVDKIADAAHHRTHPHLPELSPWSVRGPIDVWPVRELRDELAAPLVEYVCWIAYRNPDRVVLHGLGLTEPILAHVRMRADRPGHKWGLMPLARDLAAVREWAGDRVGRGMYERAVAAGVAAEWITSNIDAIVMIERKIYNHSELGENLRLAFTRVPEIVPNP
jgi:hypothetical protein